MDRIILSMWYSSYDIHMIITPAQCIKFCAIVFNYSQKVTIHCHNRLHTIIHAGGPKIRFQFWYSSHHLTCIWSIFKSPLHFNSCHLATTDTTWERKENTLIIYFWVARRIQEVPRCIRFMRTKCVQMSTRMWDCIQSNYILLLRFPDKRRQVSRKCWY